MDYGTEAIVQRIGQSTNKGIVSTPLNDNTQVKYNTDTDDDHTLLHILADWAKTHDRRLLMPFNAFCSIDTLRSCDAYIAITADRHYLMGRIDTCGTTWQADNPPATPGYSVPDDYLATEQTFWVALDDVAYGEDFDFTDWWTSPSKGTDMNQLKQMFDNSKVAMMYATKLKLS